MEFPRMTTVPTYSPLDCSVSSRTTLRNASYPRSVPTRVRFPLRQNFSFLSWNGQRVCVSTNEKCIISSFVWLFCQHLIVAYHKSLEIWSFLKLRSHASVLGDVVVKEKKKAIKRFVTSPSSLLICATILVGSKSETACLTQRIQLLSKSWQD